MSARAFTAVLLLALTGCALRPLPPARAPRGPTFTIFVPGYRGSALLDPGNEDEPVWLSPLGALQPRTSSLALPSALAVGEPLTSLVLLPGLFEIDIYETAILRGRRELDGFVEYAYDWRRDIRDSAVGLCAVKDALLARGGPDAKVRIVAHSMGGLVALSCLSTPAPNGAPWEGAGGVTEVAFVGTPFGGAPAAFDDVLFGTVTGLNRSLLSREALFTFPSIWQLLPDPEEGGLLVDPSGRPAALDLSSPELLASHEWSVFEDPSRANQPVYRAELADRWAGNRALHAELRERTATPAPFRTLAIVGEGRPTVSAWTLANDGVDFEHPVFADGDGTVTAARAIPPAPLSALVIRSPAEHVELMRADDVWRSLERFLEAKP